MKGTNVARALMGAALALAFAAHVYLAWHYNVNWDEFFFLSLVFDYVRGTLATPIQTFHVHLFGWLTRVQGQEVDQVIVARAVYLFLLSGTCACIYRIARRTSSVDGALFAVLCYAAYTFVLSHGTAFRADGVSVFLLMTALVIAQSTQRTLALGASAVLVAIALLVTLKSVFFLPVFAFVLLVDPTPASPRIIRPRAAVVFAAVLAGTAAGLYVWHSSQVASVAVTSMATRFRSTASVALQHPPLPRLPDFVATVESNPVQWLCLAFALFVLCRRIVSGRRWLEAVSLAVLALPLLSLVVYRNTFPYFYVFILPPAFVLCATAFDELSFDRGIRTGRGVAASLLATSAILASAMSHVSPLLWDSTIAQRTVIQAVHEIFPQPVPYIDRNGMIASFPKVGFFMSSWGIQLYQDKGPVFIDLLRTRQPQFVLANSPALESALDEKRADTPLHPEDAAALRAHFVKYWGPIYIAGTHLHLEPGRDVQWEVLIGGAYRLRSDGPVSIANVIYEPGAIVRLNAGPVTFRADAMQNVTLLIDSARDVPAYPPPQALLYLNL